MSRTPKPRRSFGRLSRPAARDAARVEPAATRPTGWKEQDNVAFSRHDVVASVPFELQVAAAYAWRIIAVGAAVYVLWRVISMTTTIMIPLAVALLLTSLLMPVAVFLNHRLGLPRHAAGAITTLGMVAVVAGLLSLAGTSLVSGVGALLDQADQAVTQISDWLATGPLHLGGDQISSLIDAGQNWFRENRASLTSGALRASGTATEFLAGTLIALISTFFFLSEGDRIWSWLVRVLPGVVQEPVHEGFRRGFVTLGSYTKTQCIVAAVDALFIAIGAAILGLPLLLPLGLIIFFGSFIPIVGAFLSGTLAVLIALMVKGPVAAVLMLAIILFVQQVEGHILQPVLMSRAVALHPLAVILAVAVGSFLWGIPGALFAVPVLAMMNTVMLYWIGHDKFPGLAQGMSAVGVSAKVLAGEDENGVAATEKQVKASTRYIGDVTPALVRSADRSLRAAATRDARATAADDGLTPDPHPTKGHGTTGRQ